MPKREIVLEPDANPEPITLDPETRRRFVEALANQLMASAAFACRAGLRPCESACISEPGPLCAQAAAELERCNAKLPPAEGR